MHKITVANTTRFKWVARTPNYIYLLIRLVRFRRLLEQRGQDTVGPLKCCQIVCPIKLAQSHRLRVYHQRMHLNQAGKHVDGCW